MNTNIFSRRCWFLLALLTAGIALGQGTAPNAGLIYVQTIPVPTWTNTGSTQANLDLITFNPATRTLYVADRTNHSVTAIDTKTNEYIGLLPVPSGGSTNGVVIANDLQQLIATDGQNHAYVWNLRAPGSAPDAYTIPNITSGTDGVEYDPLNRRAYVANTNAPYYLTAIDLQYKTIASQFPIPYAPELFRFNPNDGLIYLSITDSDNNNANAGMMVYDPVANIMKMLYKVPNCVPHGFAIDPVANAALLGCSPGPQTLISLKDGSIINQFSDITGTDLLEFNFNTRRFYTGSASNSTTVTGCPKDSSGNYPIIGVIDAIVSGGREVGVTCSGRSTKGPGIDPFQNNIYVGTRQYPVNAADATTGSPGVMVFWDPSGPVQPLTTQTQATLSAGAITGTAKMHPAGRYLRVDSTFSGISGNSALLNITTTVGNESLPCGINHSNNTALCNGPILGDPLIGGAVGLAVDGVPAAFGTIKNATGQ
jgi:hypothetical protein